MGIPLPARLGRDDEITTNGPVPPPPDLTTYGLNVVMSEKPPEVSGFRLNRLLGRGGMGVVYAATQTGLDREVAIKFLTAPNYRDEAVCRFRAEARHVARLQHPNVVQLFEVGETDEGPYLVFELMPGGSLSAFLTAGPLAARRAAEVVGQLARAIEAAHAAGIVHRDLKPGNVLLGRDGTPKVSDFGVAKAFGADESSTVTSTGVVLGTPSYMAPEQADGRTDVGPVADVYALGAILYECLTGRPPFRAANPVETLDLVRTSDPVPPRRLQPGVPTDLETICLKCLRKETDHRYRTAHELAEDLDRFLHGRTIRARPVGVLERAWKSARRNPAWAALLVITVLVPVAAAAGVIVHTTRLERALTEKDSEQKRATAERDRADANYRHAREALRRMLAELTDRRYAELPRLKELRNSQAEHVLAYFRSVADFRDDPAPEVRSDAAQAELEAAKLCLVIGRQDQAAEHAGRARESFARLVSEFPDNRAYRFGHAEAIVALAGARGHLGAPFEPAIQLYSDAIAELEPLATDPLAPAGVADVLASAHNDLGGTYYNAKQYTAAEPHFLTAFRERVRLSATAPADREAARRLAETALNLSVLFTQTGRMAEAEDYHGRADAILARLVADDPTDSAAVCRLAVLRVNRSYTLAARGKEADAVSSLTVLLPVLEVLHRKEPADPMVRDTLYRVHGARAQLHERLGQFAAAVTDAEKVVEYAATPDRKRFHRLFLNRFRVRAGDAAGALAEAEDLLRSFGPGVPYLEPHHQAETCALLADRLRAAAALAPPALAADLDRAEHLAVQCLDRAKAAATSEEWAKLRDEVLRDPAFAGLRGRTDFRAVCGP